MNPPTQPNPNPDPNPPVSAPDPPAPTATPPPTPTVITPNPPASPEHDPFVQMMAESFKAALDTPIPPAPPKAELVDDHRTLAEMVAESQEKKAALENQPPTPPAPPVTPPTPPPEPPPDPVKEAPVKLEKSSVDELQSKLDSLKQIPPPPPPVTPASPPAKTAESEDAYIATLSDEQKEELAFAKWAESHGYPDQVNKVLSYFKAVEKAAEEHGTDSDEFKAVEKQTPKYQNRRKLELTWIKEQAKEEAKNEVKAELAPQAEAIARRQHIMEVAPKIAEAIAGFEKVLVSSDLVLPKDVSPITSVVSETIRSKGYEAAQELFPVEAPIYASTVEAAREYLNIVEGVKDYDPQNPVHSWIAKFISRQEQLLMEQPNDKRIWNGKPFLPAGEYAKLPAEKIQEFTTFSDSDVMKLLATHAATKCHRELSRLAKAGFVRKPEEVKTKTEAPVSPSPPSPAPSIPATPPQAAPISPKAGSTPAPGAGFVTQPVPPGVGQWERLIPGLSKMVGAT